LLKLRGRYRPRLAARHRLEQLEEIVDLSQREAQPLSAFDETQAHELAASITPCTSKRALRFRE